MKLSVNKLATRDIRPQPEVDESKHTGQAATALKLDNEGSDLTAPPFTDGELSPADFPGETHNPETRTVNPDDEVALSHDFAADQKAIEQGLTEAATEDADPGIEQPDPPPAAKNNGKKGWARAAYGVVSGDQPAELLDVDARLKRTRFIPELGGLPNSKANRRLAREGRVYKPAPLANSVFKLMAWDTRESHFNDFYADPLQWPEPLVLQVIQWYKQGICLREILSRIVKPKQRAKLPAFTLNTIGPLRLIDIYALLATCVYIGTGTAFAGDPRYTKFGITEAREPIVTEDNPSDTELPLDCFLYAYKKVARNPVAKWVDVSNELLVAFKLTPIQAGYTFRMQLSKSIKRRLIDIRRLRVVEFDPIKAGKALLKQTELHALAFRHGDQVLALLPWPSTLDVPLSTVPGEHIYPLSYLIEGLKSLTIRLDQPAHDILQHLRNLLSTYLAENRPAVTVDGGTLTGFISQGN